MIKKNKVLFEKYLNVISEQEDDYELGDVYKKALDASKGLINSKISSIKKEYNTLFDTGINYDYSGVSDPADKAGQLIERARTLKKFGDYKGNFSMGNIYQDMKGLFNSPNSQMFDVDAYKFYQKHGEKKLIQVFMKQIKKTISSY